MGSTGKKEKNGEGVEQTAKKRKTDLIYKLNLIIT